MKKRLKVFESGNYPQGNFEADRVKAVFEKVVDKIPGIFAHSSHWAKKEEEPVSVGEFSNFELLNKNGKLVVFGDVEFNEKGAGYYNDKILEGVSVEIDPKTNTLHKIAVLPKGVKPQVAGAEFELKEDELQGIYLQFEEFEEEKMTLEQIMATFPVLSLDDRAKLINSLVSTVTDEERSGMRKLMEWEKVEAIQVEPKVPKTEDEIRAEITAQMEFEAKRNQLIEKAKAKFTPAQQEFIEFALKKAGEERATVLEFEANGKKENMSYFERFEKAIETMEDAANFTSKTKELEFENKEEKTDVMKQAYDRTKARFSK